MRPEEYPRNGTEAEQLFFLLRYAVLAPSSHNAQPWHFGLKNDTITVSAEYQRALPKADPENRLLFCALGCAIENIVVAADYFGWKTQVKYAVKKQSDWIATIDCVSKAPTQLSQRHLIFAIPSRHTNRLAYEKLQPPAEIIDQMRQSGDEMVTVHIITDDNTKRHLADLINVARIEAMEQKPFRAEMAAYKKNNWTHSPLGMPGFDMGFSLVRSVLTPTVLRHYNVARLMVQAELQLLTHSTPVMVVVATKADTPEAWVRAGRVLEHLLLEAEAKGLRTAVTVAATQVGNYYQAVQKLLRISERPQICFRLGYGTRMSPHSPRFTAAEVLNGSL